MAWLPLPDRPYAFTVAKLPEGALEGVSGWLQTTVKGKPITIVPHDYHSWMRLRANGLVIPAPTARYSWPGHFEPMDHQRATVDFLIQHAKAFCLNGLRTGKTLSALWGADYLIEAGVVRRVLIVAPKRICDIVWERNLFQHMGHRKYVFLKGTRQRKQTLAEDTRIEFLIVNPESLHLIVDHLPDVDLVVIDEFTRFKNVRVGGKDSRRYRALQRITREARLWMMSGKPSPQSPLDAYGPIRLINPRRLSFTQWRDMTMLQLSEHKYVPRFGVASTVAEWMTPAVRFKREDCIDIPEEKVEELEVELTKKQREVIEAFKREASAEIRSGVKINALNAAGTLLKMLQVMSGGVYGEDPNGERATYSVDAAPYFEAVEEIVEESDRPVLVFCNFQCSVHATADHLEKQGYRVGRLTGGRPMLDGKRVDSMVLFDEFQAGTLDAIVAIPSTMQYGLELTTGYVVLWASPPFSYETYDQANARVTGAAQERTVMIMHLIQSPITKKLFDRLETRAELQDAILDLVEGKISV